MRVTFVLPGRAQRFSGGFNVLYQYAVRLAQQGQTIRLVHTPYLGESDSFWSRCRVGLVYLAGRWKLLDWSPSVWLPSQAGVEVLWAPRISEDTLPDADAIIVSFAQTAERVGRLSAAKGRRFYLVQEYELFMTAPPEQQRRMARAFNLDFRRLAISPAVARMLEQTGAPAHGYLPNGIDLDEFQLAVPIEDTRRSMIGFPHRPESFKCSGLAVQAIEQARQQLGRHLEVWTFGRKRPSDLPAWIRYVTNPMGSDLAALYNQTAVFVTPSEFEGWGLPGCESIACGAALVSADNGGVHAYAEHGTTALISPAGDVDALAKNIVRLVQDTRLRVELATRGHMHVQQFTWSRAVTTLARLLES